ncbi:MAG TPA: NAD(P)/FAD-dependent oxidoreductase [Sporichthyaceae bacterium]|jgi:flavin-dependent dehydrogenase|nr:NAD(P)/FAD-dependent oxidoreductase [Sporichthyaceae bacterium]
MATTEQPEQVDVVVVGGRIGGSAVAIALARAGRRVLVLDNAAFPSDTVSTHVMFAGGLAELKRLGALDRVLAAGAPPCPNLMLSAEGLEVHGTYTPVDGIDYGLNTRRPALDMALVTTAREAGAELRERSKVTGVVWQGNRVAGVRYTDPDGAEHTVLAKLTIGADGRDSRFAEWVGSARYKALPNGRGLAFHYMTDSEEGAKHYPHRDAICQWRHGEINGFVFPNNDDSLTALLMPSVEIVERCFRDPEEWDRVVAAQPEMSARLTGTVKEVKLRGAVDTEGYFRTSSGPGWALCGDAGSFKDPVIAQGIRDGLWSGRTLGETVAPHLDDPARLAEATRHYEWLRDKEVLATYYWGHKESRVSSLNPVEKEFYLQGENDPQIGRDLVDTFSRVISPYKLVSVPREVTWTVRALRRRGTDRRAVVQFVSEAVKLDLAYAMDRAFLKAGRRPKGTAVKRWVRDGWTEHMALGNHRPTSKPYLPEEERAAAAAARKARSTRGRRPAPAAAAEAAAESAPTQTAVPA